MKLIIATQNEHKFQEIKAHFKGFPIVIEKLPEGIKEPVESKDTFLENAILKAKYYADKLNQVVLADDSGLCVAALKGLPGIYSSRYSGLGDAANNVKLLKALTNIEQRDAYFKAVIVIYFPDGTMFHYE